MKKDKKEIKKITKKGIAVLLAGTMIGTVLVGCSNEEQEQKETQVISEEQNDEDVLFKREDGSILTLVCIEKNGIDETKFYAGYATYDKAGVYFEDAISKTKFNLSDISKFKGCEIYYTGFSSICKQEEVLDGTVTDDLIEKNINKLKLTNESYGRYYAEKKGVKAALDELDIKFVIESTKESECTYNLLDSSVIDKNKIMGPKIEATELISQDDILLEKEDGEILQLLVTSNVDTDEDAFSCGYVSYSAFGVYFENAITGVVTELNDTSKFDSCIFKTVPFCSVISTEDAIKGVISKTLVEDTMDDMKLRYHRYDVYKVVKKNINVFLSNIHIHELMEETIDSPDKYDLTSKKRVGTRLTANSDEALFIREDGARLRLLYTYDLNELEKACFCGYITYDSNGMYFDDVITGEKTNLTDKEKNTLMTEETFEKYCAEEDVLSGKLSKQSISEICKNISDSDFPTDYVLAEYHVKYAEEVGVTYDLNGSKLLK